MTSIWGWQHKDKQNDTAALQAAACLNSQSVVQLIFAKASHEQCRQLQASCCLVYRSQVWSNVSDAMYSTMKTHSIRTMRCVEILYVDVNMSDPTLSLMTRSAEMCDRKGGVTETDNTHPVTRHWTSNRINMYTKIVTSCCFKVNLNERSHPYKEY